MSVITTKTELISVWGRTHPAVELWSRRSHARARSSPCRGLAGCITAAWLPPECSTCRETHLRFSLPPPSGENRVSNPIQSKQIGAMPNAALPRFELTGRPTCNSSGSDGPKHGILSFGEPQRKHQGIIAKSKPGRCASKSLILRTYGIVASHNRFRPVFAKFSVQ